MKVLRYLNKTALLALIGGTAYALIEILWRGHTHWTMAVLGGILFVLLGGFNEHCNMPLLQQSILGALLVTVAEFAAGLILNVWLGMDIWDYSDVPGNLLGQICPQFLFAWMGLALVAIWLDDWLRYWLWAEPRPRYTLVHR